MLIESDENTSSTYAKSEDSDINDLHVRNEKMKQDIFNETIESYQEEKSFASSSGLNCFACCTDKDMSRKKKANSKFSKYTRISFYRNNISFFVLILVYILISIALVFIQLSFYMDKNSAYKTARAAGMLLNFNCSLIILLVLRRLLTWLRNSFIGTNFLPLDDFIKFHKFIGGFIVVLTIIHTIGHMVNLCE